MNSIPLWPVGWYAIEASKHLKVGSIIERKIAGKSIVVYRSELGKAVAIDAHCPHMGAHLKAACVQGEFLRCALHHWKIGESATLCNTLGEPLPFKSQAWRTAEHFGLLFLYFGDDADAVFPIIDDQQYIWVSGRPKRLRADWRAIIINGYDILHMQTVHQRTLISEPKFHQTAKFLQMDFSSKVEKNGGFSSWFTRLISREHMIIRSTCYGASIKIESQMGKFKAKAIFFSLPDENGANATTVFPTFGIPKDALFAKLQVRIARYLYMAFLRKDFSVIEGIKLVLHRPITDIGVKNITNFLSTLEGIEVD